MTQEIIEGLNMGGYALYVWPAYAITAVVLIGNLVAAVRKKKKNASRT